jgi:hypothetical protein
MPTINFETGAWMRTSELHRLTGTSEDIAPQATSFSMFDFDASCMGYTRVGTARMTVELVSEKELRTSVAATLRAQIDKERAESHNRITNLTRQLNEVLAIEFRAEEVTA